MLKLRNKVYIKALQAEKDRPQIGPKHPYFITRIREGPNGRIYDLYRCDQNDLETFQYNVPEKSLKRVVKQ